MCSLILRLIFSVLAIILGTTGIVLLSARARSLDSNIYSNTLKISGIYDFATKEINSNLEKFTADPENPEQSAGQAIARRMVSLLLSKIDLKNLLQLTLENNLRNITVWIDSGSSELMVYFPRNELLSSFKTTEFKTELIKTIRAEIVNLPVCTEPPSETSALTIPNCKPDNTKQGEDKFIEIFSAEYDKQFEKQGPIETYLNQIGFGTESNTSPLSVILSTQPEKSQQDVRQFLQNIKNVFATVQLIGIIALAIAIFLTFLTLILGSLKPRRLLGSPSQIWILVGLLTLILGIILKLSPELVLGRIDFSQFIPSVELASILKKILIELSGQLFDYTIITAIVILIISFIVKLISFIIPSGRAKKDSDKTEPAISQGKPLISESVLGRDSLQTISKP